MIKLVYDVRCGFKQLYMTEKDCELDLDYLVQDMIENQNHSPATAETELYNDLSAMSQSELEEYFEDNGILDSIEESTELEYAHSYFRDICFGQEDACVPGFTKIYNLRVEVCQTISEATATGMPDSKPLADTFKAVDYWSPMKACDVLAYLGISRQTLSNYVKRGLIKIDSNYTGKQYRYDRESVIALKKNK